MLKWEEIVADRGARLKRAKTREGWLVAAVDGPTRGRVSFLHDPAHDWSGELIELQS